MGDIKNSKKSTDDKSNWMKKGMEKKEVTAWQARTEMCKPSVVRRLRQL